MSRHFLDNYCATLRAACRCGTTCDTIQTRCAEDVLAGLHHHWCRPRFEADGALEVFGAQRFELIAVQNAKNRARWSDARLHMLSLLLLRW